MRVWDSLTYDWISYEALPEILQEVLHGMLLLVTRGCAEQHKDRRTREALQEMARVKMK